jgi:hypothetical protein
MTAAAQKEIMKKALALPEKARRTLLRRINESLGISSENSLRKHVVSEPSATYGPRKTRKQSVKHPPGEDISRKEWNEAWKGELEKRIADVESGKVKCIPYAEARKRWNKILGRT